MYLLSASHRTISANSLVHLSLLANNDLPSYLNFKTHIDNIKSFTNLPNILEINKNKVRLSLQTSYKKLWKSQLQLSKKGKFLRDMDKEFKCEPYLSLHDYNCCAAATDSCAVASLGEIDSRCLYVFLSVFNNFAVTSVSGY